MSHISRFFLASAVLALAPHMAKAQLLPSASQERCAPAPNGTPSAATWLARAATRVLPVSLDGKVLRYRATQDQQYWEQSDRSYEPFVPNPSTTMRWFDPAVNIEGTQSVERPLAAGKLPATMLSLTTLANVRDTSVFIASRNARTSNTQLNPWMVLLDWRERANDVKVVGRCTYREYPRIVLALGDERLYVSESDATPIKVERVEPHYLWGQVKTEYLWSTWWNVRGGGQYPLAAFRLVDGATYERVAITSGSATLVAADSAPMMRIPSNAPMIPQPAFMTAPLKVDTVRMADSVFALVTPMYTHAVALVKDTVYLFDATSSEERSRADSAWIQQLFPGKHAIVLVVTDLAWPHISGVRYWVARGATVVSHRESEAFLRRVVDRHWTLAPDALEKSRKPMRFVGLTDSLRLAGGGVVLHALRGTTTETAIGAWLPRTRIFWAGDYVQGGAASPYSRDVVQTIRTLGLTPATIGAQHIKPMPWATLESNFPAPLPLR